LAFEEEAQCFQYVRLIVADEYSDGVDWGSLGHRLHQDIRRLGARFRWERRFGEAYPGIFSPQRRQGAERKKKKHRESAEKAEVTLRYRDAAVYRRFFPAGVADEAARPGGLLARCVRRRDGNGKSSPVFSRSVTNVYLDVPKDAGARRAQPAEL
jgi:hypothetical protein